MLNLDLFRNYLKTSWRYLLKDRLFTLLNLAGLSTGLVCTMLICLWIANEIGFDKFHRKDERLFEVMIHEQAGNRIATSNGTGDQMCETMLNELAEIETVVVTTPASWFQKFSLSVGANTISAGGNFVSRDYFNAFSLPLIQGNEDQVLAHKNSIAISEKLAVKLFRSPDLAVGKILEWKWQETWVMIKTTLFILK